MPKAKKAKRAAKPARKAAKRAKAPAAKRSKAPAAKRGGGFSALETTILQGKGLTAAQLKALAKAGIRSKADFATVGDADTLVGLVAGLTRETAAAVLAWARTGGAGGVVVESPDVIYCVHCGTRQPKDWKSGDLCVQCGREAEPVHSCFWCNQAGPGKFCRRCGTVFVPDAEVELAAQLKREGMAKDDIPARLAALSPAEKDALRSRAARYR
jgi:hypothetical protein